MMSLRRRFAALLILAIVTVVGLATFAASWALQPPLPETTMLPLARQLRTLATLARDAREAAIAAGVTVQSAPAAGNEESRMSQVLTHALEKMGTSATVIVNRSANSPVLRASFALGNGEWLVSDIPDLRPPPGGRTALAGWIALIVAGSTAISLFAASRITKPLELLESAAGRIGTDGLLTHIPETGSGEVRATAKALNRLSARLKSAMDSRMRLVAAAGHDLRTPMTRMRLRAEFIPDDEEREKWLADIQELDTIADSAIRLVREEAGNHGSESIALDRLVRDTANELLALGQDVTALQLAPLHVEASPIALKRALRNLLVNAATHGRAATVTLEHDGTMALLTVRDDGPGIPEELIGRVFEPFFRVDIARRKILPGAGLGLAIAREIIERFGGTITIANREPNGLLQSVRLPLANPEQARPPVS